MPFKTTMAAAFENLKIAFPAAVAAVVFNDKTAQGLLMNTIADTNLADEGELGLTTGSIQVKSADIDEPGKGATIKVGGTDVFVLRVKNNKAAGQMVIDFSEQKPI